MLSWTSKGAVSSPAVLQVRLNSATGGLVTVGAPSPSRSVTVDEFHQNLAYFSTGRGSRAVPIERLVLSGISKKTPIRSFMQAAANAGVQHTTLHLSAQLASELSDEISSASAVAIPISKMTDISALSLVPAQIFRIAILQVTERAVWSSQALLFELMTSSPDLVVITWPYAGDERMSLSSDQISDVRSAYTYLSKCNMRVLIKGMPPCIVDFCDDVGSKSSNRWYVDADHQKNEAILFFPNVVRFSKAEACRFCAITAMCDGVPSRWATLSTMRACTPIEEQK